MADRERTVAIVGGGVSGLAIAEAIERLSRDAGRPMAAVVLEADSTPGGKIKSTRESGFVLDSGPHGFLDREPAVFDLVDRLNLKGSLIRADETAEKRFIVRGGRLRKVPTSPPAFLASDILPFGARMRVLFEPFAKRRSDDEESVWAFAARRIGATAADVLIDSIVNGTFGGDPKRLSLRSAFPRMRELEDQYGSLIKAQMAIAKEKKSSSPAGAPAGVMHSFKNGLGEMTSALAKRVEVRLGQRVARIARESGGFVIEGSGVSLRARAVVSAAPADDAASMLEALAPEESKIIAQIPYAPVAVIVQAWKREAFSHPLDGFGFLAPFVEGRKILGSIWTSSIFPDHVPSGAVMLRTMIGGARNQELLELGDQALLDLAKDELSSVLGADRRAEPIFERVIRWPRGIPQYVLGHASRVAAADAIEARVPGVFLAGNAYRGIAMIACIAEAERVARRVLAFTASSGLAENLLAS